MKTVLCVIIIIGSLLIPVEKADIAKLQPVEAVALCRKDGVTEIFTDTGAWGSGRDAKEALSDLLKNTPQLVYLDTADYLMVNKEAAAEIDSIRAYLKGNVRLCLWDCKGVLSDAIQYFSVHGRLPKLKDWRQGDALPEYVTKKQ